MIEPKAPFIPETEPTEAAILREWLAEAVAFEEQSMTSFGSVPYTEKWRLRAAALRACMRAAGWRTDEEPTEEEQHIWSAG